MEDFNLLIIMYQKIFPYYDSYANYSRLFFNSNDDTLTLINEEQGSCYIESIDSYYLYFKGLHLKGNYSAFIYSIVRYHTRLNISSLFYDTDININGQYSFITTVQKVLWDYSINSLHECHEFIKLNEERLIFITTEELDFDAKPVFLSILLFDLNGEDYQSVNIRYYSYFLNKYNLKKKLQLIIIMAF